MRNGDSLKVTDKYTLLYLVGGRGVFEVYFKSNTVDCAPGRRVG